MNFWKARRNVMGRTQKDVADAVGKTKALVSAWERDVSVPGLELVDKLVPLYGVKADRIIQEMRRQAKRVRKSTQAEASPA